MKHFYSTWSVVNEYNSLWKQSVPVSGSFGKQSSEGGSWKRLCPQHEESVVIFHAFFSALAVCKLLRLDIRASMIFSTGSNYCA